MPVAPPVTVLDGPGEGWPWQLQLYYVIDKKGEGHNMQFRVKCKLCGWGENRGFANLYRLAVHFRGAKGADVRSITS